MKKNQWILTIMLTLTTNFIQAADIKFEISDIKSNLGKLYIQLFQGEENYKNRHALSSLAVNARKGVMTVVFSDLYEGEYALRFYHDENNSGELETNLFGLPIEGYGFSNNAMPNFGPVHYDDITFSVPVGTDTIINRTSVIY